MQKIFRTQIKQNLFVSKKKLDLKLSFLHT